MGNIGEDEDDNVWGDSEGKGNKGFVFEENKDGEISELESDGMKSVEESSRDMIAASNFVGFQKH